MKLKIYAYVVMCEKKELHIGEPFTVEEARASAKAIDFEEEKVNDLNLDGTGVKQLVSNDIMEYGFIVAKSEKHAEKLAYEQIDLLKDKKPNQTNNEVII